MNRFGLILLGLVLAAPMTLSCERASPNEPMSSETFIEIVVSLRRAAFEATPGQFEDRKAAILSEYGVTDSMLTAYVERHGRDLPRMAEIWDSIDARLAQMIEDSLSERD